MGLFDIAFPNDIESEFNNRSSYIRNKDVKWNYDKYCWIQMTATGKSSTVMCPTSYGPIGDGSPNTQVGHNDLYVTEGGVRKFRPQLKSVNINNNGASDYTDALIYEVEASFTVYTLAQLEEINKSFFKAGSEVEFKFGWEGYSSGVNKGSCKANVYNFSFSLNEDGSFDCTIKCMSAAGLWAGDDMGGTTKSEKEDDDNKFADFLQTMKTDLRAAFGLEAAADIDDVDDIGNNKLSGKKVTTKYGESIFYASEIFVKPGWDDEEQYVSFCSLGTLMNYINFKSKGTDAITEYKIDGESSADEKDMVSWDMNKVHIGSADPTKFVLPGKQGNYGDASVPNKGWFDGDISKNFAGWGDVINSVDGGNNAIPLKQILISIEYMDEVYADLAKSAGKKGGVQIQPKVSDFIGTIGTKLNLLTGGMVNLKFIPYNSSGELMQTTNQSVSVGNKIILKLVNDKMVSSKAAAESQTPYTFKTLSKGTITRAVSLSTDMDSDTLLMMAPTNIGKGTSKMEKAEELNESNCGKSATAKAEKDADNPTPEDIAKIRYEYGAGGFDSQKISSYTEMIMNSLKREPPAKGRYSEVLFAWDLSITIDGIWGIPFMAPIIIDRIPSIYKKSNIIFSVTGVSHSFDGQGDWSTELSTVMRVV